MKRGRVVIVVMALSERDAAARARKLLPGYRVVSVKEEQEETPP